MGNIEMKKKLMKNSDKRESLLKLLDGTVSNEFREIQLTRRARQKD